MKFKKNIEITSLKGSPKKFGGEFKADTDEFEIKLMNKADRILFNKVGKDLKKYRKLKKLIKITQ